MIVATSVRWNEREYGATVSLPVLWAAAALSFAFSSSCVAQCLNSASSVPAPALPAASSERTGRALAAGHLQLRDLVPQALIVVVHGAVRQRGRGWDGGHSAQRPQPCSARARRREGRWQPVGPVRVRHVVNAPAGGLPGGPQQAQLLCDASDQAGGQQAVQVQVHAAADHRLLIAAGSSVP